MFSSELHTTYVFKMTKLENTLVTWVIAPQKLSNKKIFPMSILLGNEVRWVKYIKINAILNIGIL